MKLRRLAIQRLPGIDEPFALEDLGDGLHVVVGPNGIGKSSLCRAARALLFRERAPEAYVAASARFDRQGEQWQVERDGARHYWQRDGVDSEAPPLPVAYLEGCFFLLLRDLLDASSEAGSDLAGEIRRQMSGGFDLEGAEASLFGAVGPRHGYQQRSDLGEAEREVRKAALRQAELAGREDRLADLERERDAAEGAQHRRVHFDRALEVRDARADLAQVEADLEALPEALERLTGDELAQLEQRQKELEEKRRLRRDAELDLETARQAAAATRLAEPLDAAALRAWRERAENLADLESRLEAAEEVWKGCQRALAEAGRAVGAGDGATPGIDLAGAAELFAFLREVTSAENEREAISRRLELLEGRVLSEQHGPRLDLLRRGVDPLRRWLRAPDPEAGSGGVSGGKRSVVAVAAALVVAGAALAFAVHPAFALFAGVGLGLAGALWLLRPVRGLGYAREAARREFPSGLESPSAWTTDRVTERLRVLEAELAELEAGWQRARDRGVERAELENQRKVAAERQAELERRRRELASRLGLDDIPPNAELVDMARALDQLRRARADEARAAERVRDIAGRHRAIFSELSSEIAARGEAESTDLASLRAGLDRLRERDAQLREARTREENARRSVVRLDGELAQVEEIISEIYRRAGLEVGDGAGLARLLEDRERHRALRSRRDVLAESIRRGEERLAAASELELTQLDRGKLEAEKRELEERASGLDRLRGDLADIRAEVRRAREGHDLEEAIARRDAVLGSLEDRRQEAMWAAAGRFLLDTVKLEHETSQMPRVLERARQLLSAFTHHAYELRVAPDETGSFVAVDVKSGARRRPQELSDGTRAQLLLAARLAFAEEAERGARLPLFLDEALDQSDPVRFRAIARSLGRMVEDEGRQIFYLTADPGDARRLQDALDEEGCAAPRVIDLAAVRSRVAGVSEIDALRVEPMPELPGPAGHTTESYGMALGVPPLDPRREATAQHLFYLLWDDLPLLHRLLESRIEGVGQWLLLSRNRAPLATQIAAEEGAGSQLDARAELLEAFCRAWREGRGKPVDREALERSDAVSAHYLEDVVAIARELSGDGARLIAALHARDDERLRGFLSKKADALESFLVEEGYIDPRPIPGEPDVAVRAVATPAAARLPERLAAECLHRWWSLCQRRA